ncbi:hypothetical protein [Allocoleopsis sp.]|uniref:hypothetical protein n=1 Tax=Allocoleopsis sp. TaxID=3088169 RepID=UPI002FD1DCE0
MATINIENKLFASSEEEALKVGIPQLKALWEQVEDALKTVEMDCQVKFPNLVMTEEECDPDRIGADKLDEMDGKTIWAVSFTAWIHTVKSDDPDYRFDEYAVMEATGKTVNKNFYEPLQQCDWSSFKPLLAANNETIGDFISVEFDGVYVTSQQDDVRATSDYL